MKRILLLYLLTFGCCVLANPSNDKGKLISLQGEYMPDSGFLGVGLEYGQNILFQRSYLGFFGVGVSFYYMFNDDLLFYNEKMRMSYFTKLDYGWEFMRHNVISLGLNTTHGLGLTYKAKAVFSNGIGIFGKVQKDSIALYAGFGIKHLNPFGSLAYERMDFYWQLKLQYRL